MKKEYVKPYLALESFQLVAALAGACNGAGQTPLNQSIDECTAVEEGGGMLFGNACTVNVHLQPNICHQGPVNGGTYLTS